jgi:hypothetical protein
MQNASVPMHGTWLNYTEQINDKQTNYLGTITKNAAALVVKCRNDKQKRK